MFFSSKSYYFSSNLCIDFKPAETPDPARIPTIVGFLASSILSVSVQMGR